MSNEKDIEIVLNLLHKNKPIHTYNNLMSSDMGIMGVIKFLNDSEGEVKSKDISDDLKISSARMAVLLKKLESKNIIERSASISDARITIVRLSDKGKKIAFQTKSNLQKSAQILIDEFGLEHILKVLNDMQKVKEIMEETMKNSEEIIND